MKNIILNIITTINQIIVVENPPEEESQLEPDGEELDNEELNKLRVNNVATTRATDLGRIIADASASMASK